MNHSEVIRTLCSYCSVGCAIDVKIEHGQSAKVLPAMDYPVNLGKTCSKGFNLLKPMMAEDRALYPMLRGAGGELERISWDEAANVFVQRMQAVQHQFGKESVAVISTGQLPMEEMAFLGCFARFGMGVRHVDGNTRQCMATSVVAYKQAFGFDAPPYTYRDAEESDCLIFIGANPVVAHPIFWDRVKRNRRHPAIVVIDPRQTETAREATLHLALQPKSDLILLYGLANWLISHGHVQLEWLARHTQGFEQFSEHVRDFSLEDCARAGGLPVSQLEELALLIATRERVSFWWTMGINQSHQGVRTAQAIINLCLMTGQIGRVGTGPNSLTGQANAMGSRIFSNSTSLLGGHDFANPHHRAKIAGILGIADDLIPPDAGQPYDQFLESIDQGAIKALWIVCTNPAHSWIHKSQFFERCAKLDFLVVQDLYANTLTAGLADLVLPAAGSPEKDGTFINSERRLGIVQKVINPPGEALSDFEIIKKLSEAWGLGKRFAAWTDIDAAFEIIRRASAGQPCDITGIKNRQQLLDQGGIQWPFTNKESAVGCEKERRLFENGHFFQPDGRARFLMASPEPAPELPNSEWPFWLITGRGSSHQWHTQTRTGKVDSTRQLYPQRAYAQVHPADAVQRGIQQGDRIRIESRRGHMIVDAEIDTGIQPGQVFIPMHYEEVNKLTCPVFDPLSYQPAYKMAAVNVRKEGPA
jgi:anaerobic selenocysteine-containing dehydrogenase